MIQANLKILDLLSALTVTGNLPLSGLSKEGTGEQGFDFSSLLDGLTGVKSAGKEDLLGTESLLSPEDMDFIAGLMAGDQIAQARPFFIPLNGCDKSSNAKPVLQGDISTMEISPGAGKYLQIEGMMAGIEEAAVSNPGKDLALGNDFLMLNGMAQNDLANQSAQQGAGMQSKSLSELLPIGELEKLMPGEKLSLTFINEETGAIENADFTKTGQSESFNGREFSRFDIELQGEGKSPKLNALLISPSSKGEKTIGDLIQVMESHKPSDAKLIVFLPQEEAIEQGLTSKEKNPVMKMDQILSGRFIIDDAMSQQRQIQLREINLQNNDVQSRNGLPSQEEGNVKVIIGNDGRSDANQGSMNQNANNANLNYSVFEFTNAHKPGSENFSEKPGDLQFTLTQNQDALSIDEKSEAGSLAQTKDINQFRNVLFKLEPPTGGTNIPEGGYFRIKLEPEELGKIDVELRIEHDKLVARMKVDTPLARQVVESHLPQLRDTLHSHGIKVENIMVDLNNNAGDFNHNLNGQQAQNQLAGRIRFNQGMDLSREDVGLDSDFAPSNRILNLKGNLSLLA